MAEVLQSGSGRRLKAILRVCADCLHFRAHLVGYFRGFERSNEMKQQLQTLRTVDDILGIVNEQLK